MHWVRCDGLRIYWLIYLQRHPFFESVDWDLLLAKKIEPPFKPHLRSHEDSKYFPADVKREPVLSDEGDGPDAAFGTATRRTRTQRSRTPASRSTGNSSRSSNSRVAAATVADPVASGNCTATAYTGTTRQPEDACTEGHSHACSSHSSHNSQHTEDEEGEALFKGFTYDERLQGSVYSLGSNAGCPVSVLSMYKLPRSWARGNGIRYSPICSVASVVSGPGAKRQHLRTTPTISRRCIDAASVVFP